MAKRLSGTEKWDKAWYRKLKPKHKCFWEYLRDKCDLVGLWEIDFESASFHVGDDILEDEVFLVFKKHIKRVGDKILILDFCRFQYGENLNLKSPIHKKVFDILNKYTLYNTLYGSVLNTTEKEVIDNKDESDKEEEKEIEIEIYPSFTDFWDLYDKKVGKKEKIQNKWEKLPQKTKETIVEYIPYYIDSQPEKKYRKNPETFLNNEAWKDEIINNQSNEQQINQSTTGASPEFRRKTAERVGVTKPE